MDTTIAGMPGLTTVEECLSQGDHDEKSQPEPSPHYARPIAHRCRRDCDEHRSEFGSAGAQGSALNGGQAIDRSDS
jgi:hypothetical protein